MREMSVTKYDYGWETKWDDMKTYGPFSRHLRRLIKDMIRPLNFDTVLDVGCGQGSLLAELCSEFPHIKPHGCDISAAALELAQQKIPLGRFSLLDIAKDHVIDKFDLIVCSEVLEHISDDMAVLENLAHMTAKYLVISAPQGRMRRFEADQVGHVRNYASGELVQKVEKSGFEVTSVIEWGFPFYSPLYRNLLELTGSRGTTGEFGPVRKAISDAIYLLFMLNSSKRGDEILILAESPSARPRRHDGYASSLNVTRGL